MTDHPTIECPTCGAAARLVVNGACGACADGWEREAIDDILRA